MHFHVVSDHFHAGLTKPRARSARSRRTNSSPAATLGIHSAGHIVPAPARVIFTVASRTTDPVNGHGSGCGGCITNQATNLERRCRTRSDAPQTKRGCRDDGDRTCPFNASESRGIIKWQNSRSSRARERARARRRVTRASGLPPCILFSLSLFLFPPLPQSLFLSLLSTRSKNYFPRN